MTKYLKMNIVWWCKLKYFTFHEYYLLARSGKHGNPSSCAMKLTRWTTVFSSGRNVTQDKVFSIHTMKTCNGRGVIIPPIIDLVTRYRLVVISKSRSLYLWKKHHGKRCVGGRTGPTAGLVTAPAGSGNGPLSVACSLQRLHHLDFTMIQCIRQAGISFCKVRLQRKRASK